MNAGKSSANVAIIRVMIAPPAPGAYCTGRRAFKMINAEYSGNLRTEGRRLKRTKRYVVLYTYPGYDHHCEVCSVLLDSREGCCSAH